jgi:[NiFe] hydrogenase assembly HybE family chaperone
MTAAADQDAVSVGERLAAAYRDIGARSMRDLPVYNPTLDVCSVGFRRHDGAVLGIVVTPWFMNLVVVGEDEGAAAPGATVQRRFPAGAIDFTVAALPGIGRVDSASLFSPMFDFDHPAAARGAAEAALDALFAPAEPRAALDRRAMLFGNRRREEQP